MSDNLSRTLILLEHLSAAKAEGVTVAQLVERTNLASSTVYRLVQELEGLGYLRKADDRRLFPKFLFEQGMYVGGIDIGRLTEACQSISSRLIVASEFIALRRENLFWHIAEEHPQQSIRLRAGAGFVRGAYELDCITRTALAHLPLKMIEAKWDVAAFFDVGVSGGKVHWEEARDRVAAVDTNDMQYDLMGNAKGVRRFCVAIHGTNGEFVGLLTAAEAATPLRDVEGHVAQVRAVLLETKGAVESGAGMTRSALTLNG